MKEISNLSNRKMDNILMVVKLFSFIILLLILLHLIEYYNKKELFLKFVFIYKTYIFIIFIIKLYDNFILYN